MQRWLRHLTLLTVLVTFTGVGIFFVVVSVARHTLHPTPALVIRGGLMGPLSSKSVYVFDVATGQSIYQRDANTVRPLASVTKLLSSAMFYAHASHTASTTITWHDVATEGRAGRLKAGQVYQNDVLLFPTLLESSNDAAVAMVRVSPVPLVAAMNAYAQDHGLTHTHFTDSSGLSAGDVSTARELASLVTDLRHQYPHIFDITELPLYFNHINAWLNNNPFVHEAGYAGGKHGYTDAADFTDVAYFNETLPSGSQRLVGYVLLHSNDLTGDMKTLRAYVQQHVRYE